MVGFPHSRAAASARGQATDHSYWGYLTGMRILRPAGGAEIAPSPFSPYSVGFHVDVNTEGRVFAWDVAFPLITDGSPATAVLLPDLSGGGCFSTYALDDVITSAVYYDSRTGPLPQEGVGCWKWTTHSGGQWTLRASFGSCNLTAPSPPPPQPPPPTPACARFLIIDSRGSGQRALTLSAPGGRFVDAFRAFYPGQVQAIVNPYPAVGGLQMWAGALLFPWGYNGSVVAGKNWLSKEVASVNTGPCKDVTKMILTGYSQGAQVTADVYQNGSTRNVLGVVLFGDPYFNPKDPAVDRGDYSRHPGRDGWFGARIRFGTEPGVVSRGRVISYCHDGDPVCQGPLPPQDWPAFLTYHNNYDRLNEPATAARFFAQLGS